MPASFKELEPELLIHSDWEKLPPASRDWLSEQWAWLHGKLSGWHDWSALEWMYAVAIASAVLGMLVQLRELVRRGQPAA